MLISVTILWRWNHPATICQHQFVISTRLSPLTPLSLPLWLCTLSCLWLNLTFKGEVIIMSVLKLQTATVFLFKFTPALTQAVEETKRKKKKKQNWHRWNGHAGQQEWKIRSCFASLCLIQLLRPWENPVSHMWWFYANGLSLALHKQHSSEQWTLTIKMSL